MLIHSYYKYTDPRFGQNGALKEFYFISLIIITRKPYLRCQFKIKKLIDKNVLNFYLKITREMYTLVRYFDENWM